jgi:hypothetical protein
MREPRDWDEEYLLNLPIGEFDWLEVKGRRGLDITLDRVREKDVLENLSKAISAFANSGGGVIVFGLSNPITQWEVDGGGVDLVIKKPNTREWLEDIIPTLVEFPLTSFNVYAIDRLSDSSQIAPGRAVFVIQVPDSEQAPHQAIDKRYYARVGGKSRPIGHRLVADIFGRRRYPQIDLEFVIESSTYWEGGLLLPGQRPEKRRKIELIVQARNIGRVYAQYVNCFIYLPTFLVPEPDLQDARVEEIEGRSYFVWYRANTRRDVLKRELTGPTQYGPSWFDPILPTLAQIWKWELPEDFDESDLRSDTEILWAVYADNAPRRTGSVMIREIEFVSRE